MTIALEVKQLVCWRCGGAGLINKLTDRCPGCAGTGQQGRLRPASSGDKVVGFAMLHMAGVQLARMIAAPAANQPCSSCGGSGVQTTTVTTEDGRYETRQQTCTGCGGSGRAG